MLILKIVLFVVHLKFSFDWAACILSGNSILTGNVSVLFLGSCVLKNESGAEIIRFCTDNLGQVQLWFRAVENNSCFKVRCIHILIHLVVQQKLTQHCKAIIFQLKNKSKKQPLLSILKERPRMEDDIYHLTLTQLLVVSQSFMIV